MQSKSASDRLEFDAALSASGQPSPANVLAQPALADFNLTEDRVAEASELVDIANVRLGLVVLGISVSPVFVLFISGFISGGWSDVGHAVLGSLICGGVAASIAFVSVGLLVMLLAKSIYPRYAEALEVLAQHQRFNEAKKAFDKECQQREQLYWRNLAPSAFECEVAALFLRLGMTAEVTGRSGDGGIDIRLQDGTSRAIVQCKRYKHRASPSDIREVYGALVADGADFAILVCAGGFTSGVRKFADGKPIHLVDIDRLLKLVNHTNPRINLADLLKELV